MLDNIESKIMSRHFEINDIEITQSKGLNLVIIKSKYHIYIGGVEKKILVFNLNYEYENSFNTEGVVRAA